LPHSQGRSYRTNNRQKKRNYGNPEKNKHLQFLSCLIQSKDITGEK